MSAAAPVKEPLPEQWRINRLLWICLIFVAVFIPLAHAYGWITVPLPLAFGILAVAVVNSALRTYCGWRFGTNAGIRDWIFTTVDIGVISAGVYVSGGLSSELGLAYFVTMIAESLFATPAETSGLVALIVAGYVCATWSSHSTPDYPLRLATRLFFLLMVGYFARQMSARRERKNAQLLALSEQVAASEERARIAREIHDSLGHALVASILRLELCSRLIRKEPEEAEQILKEEVPALRAAWNEGRNLAFHLRPWQHEGDSLAEALRRHISRFAERTGITVDLALEDPDLVLPEQTELALTRIIQEALTNVAKHARATRVSVRVRPDGSVIRCCVEDDGVGFAPEAADSSFGLYAMKDRAEKLGGAVEVRSRPGEGAVIEATLPRG